jgi:hypothetical protein
MAKKTTGDPIVDKLAKRKNMTGYELRSQISTPKEKTEPTGNVNPRRGRVKTEGPDKDYSGKRNIWNQQKDKVTTRESSTDRQGKVTEKKITTKTRTISPKRTVVTTEGSVASPKNKKPYNWFNPGGKLVQEGKAKTIRTKRVDKFLEKNPEYKVGDPVLKTKVKEEVKRYKPGQSNAPQTFTTKSSKKGRVAVAREYQAKSIPRKIVQSLPAAITGIMTYGVASRRGLYNEK